MEPCNGCVFLEKTDEERVFYCLMYEVNVYTLCTGIIRPTLKCKKYHSKVEINS